jgi:hypothetical protein
MADEQGSIKNREIREQDERARILELKAAVQKELTALLAHPLVPNEFKKVFEGKE